MNKKTVIVICICALLSLCCIVLNIIYEWQTEAKSFLTWLMSDEAKLFFASTIGSLGVNLISSIIFLLLVDQVIKNSIERMEKRAQIERVRNDVLRLIRTLPDKAIITLKSSYEFNCLLSDQYIGGCNLSNQNFDGLDLSGVDLTNSCLQNASLIGTNLSKAIMKDTDLTGAKMSLANLTGADIPEQALKNAHCLRNALMPDGTLYDGCYNLKGDINEASKLGLDVINDMNARTTYYSTISK